jgi:hypothetical protein
MSRPEDRVGEPIRERPVNPEPVQADPQLQLSEGRASSLQIAVVAFACLLIVGITVYGLGRPAATDGDIMASAPPAQEETTGAAPSAETAAPAPAPQGGASVPGGENVAPAGEMPQQIPAKEPVPHLVKPGVVGSDSAR